jgi:hypothetical protein
MLNYPALSEYHIASANLQYFKGQIAYTLQNLCYRNQQQKSIHSTKWLRNYHDVGVGKTRQSNSIEFSELLECKF